MTLKPFFFLLLFVLSRYIDRSYKNASFSQFSITNEPCGFATYISFPETRATRSSRISYVSPGITPFAYLGDVSWKIELKNAFQKIKSYDLYT